MPFLSDLIVESVSESDDPKWVGMGKWMLHEPLVYQSRLLKETLVVPAGFVTDMASVMRVPIIWEFCGGCAQRAAVVHDFGCAHLYFHTKTAVRVVTRAEVDAVFREAMRDSGVGPIRRTVMWAAVRMFGMLPAMFRKSMRASEG